MARKPVRTVVCPNCGELFKAGRLSCPECGSDADTGWKSWEEIEYESVELPEDGEESGKGSPLSRVWVIVLVGWMIFFLVGLGFCGVF